MKLAISVGESVYLELRTLIREVCQLRRKSQAIESKGERQKKRLMLSRDE